MSRPAILDAFASHTFLSKLDDRCLMELATGARPFTVAAGGSLGRKGAAANGFYLVQSGTVEAGDETPTGFDRLLTVEAGGVVGWSWLVPPHKWMFTARAVTPVQGLMFDAEWLRERCEQNHELGYHLLRELLAAVAARLVASRTQAAEAPV